MRKLKYCTSGLLLVFLMLYILSTIELNISSTYQFNINLNEDDNTKSWSRIIKFGKEVHSPSIEFIDNFTYIIGKIGESYIDYDIYIAKFNSSGAKLWEQTWGGSEFNHIIDYIVDSDNNLYLLGITNTFFLAHGGDIFLLKYNTTGNLLWEKTIDLYSSRYYDTLSINADLNDSIYISCIVSNSTYEKTLIIKIDASGDVLWTQEIKLNNQPNQLMTRIDSVGDIYLYGKGYDLNLFLLKVNSSGSVLWYHEWGESESGYHIKLDLDDNIIVTGISYDSGITDAWVMKINSSGSLTKKIICNSFNGFRLPKFEVWFLDNIYVLARSSFLAYNYSLNSKWNFTFGSDIPIGESWNFNFGITTQQEKYFSYLYRDEIYILSFTSSGDIISNFKWGGSYYDYLYEIGIDSQDNLYLLCTIMYVNIWKEPTHLTMLVKNPRSDGKAPQLDRLIDDRDIFVFSLLSVLSFISVVFIYKTLKPKLRELGEK